ncbi:hypothetical protein [Streptomyces kronopolitis]|uniref:hypothetical protein n=1 Tax=Streptomyces kronopolitis TaxID=1612435 RepID=UPI003D9918F8
MSDVRPSPGYGQALAEIRALTPASVRYVGYVPPAPRVSAWTELAAELADAGRTLGEIADELCVTDDTARALLAQSGQIGAAA